MLLYPQEMTEVELIVPAKDLVAVTKALGGLGVFHQTDASYYNSASVAGTPNPWQENASQLSGLERRALILLQSLGLDEGAPRNPKQDDFVDIDATRAAIERLEQETRRTTERMTAASKQLEHLQAVQRDITPLTALDIDINSLRKGEHVYTMVGTMPVANMDRIQTSLTRIPFVFLPLHQDHQTALVWLAGQRSNADILDRAARSAYLTPLTLPDGYQGRPAEVLTALEKDIQAGEKEIAEIRKDLDALAGKHSAELRKLIWEIRASRMLSDAIVRYGRLKFTYVVVGWAPLANIDSLKERVRQVSKETLIETYAVKREDRADVPVALSANRFLKPFQMLVNTYARPRYGEIDPTVLIAITFPLLYGTMFGDVGQGIVLALLGLLIVSKRVKALNGLASLGGLITACGALATVFGFLYGSVFGFEDILHPIWMRPIENIMDILLITIGAGIIILNISFLLGIFNRWKRGDYPHIFFHQTGVVGLILYWGMVLMLAGAYFGTQIAPMPVLIAMIVIGAIGVMFSEVFVHLWEGHRPLIEGGIGTFAIQVFFELFETFISFLSNTLSYVRVGAFAVAHGGLSAAIFVLAGQPGSVGYIIALILGNIFIIGFEGLIVGIQTMRLEYYEFLSKFFTGGGLRYEPLRLHPEVEK